MHYKTFQEAVSAALDQPDDAVFNPAIDEKWFVKEAKLNNTMNQLFKYICRKLFEKDMAFIDRDEFKTLIQCFTSRISTKHIDDIFSFMTKRPELKT